MFSYDLRKLPSGKSLLVFLMVLASGISPFFYIFRFYREFFERVELLKLLLICVAIGGPVYLVNLVAVVIMSTESDELSGPSDDEYLDKNAKTEEERKALRKKMIKEDFRELMGISAVITCIVFYCAIVISYIFKVSSSKTGFIIFITAEAIFIIITVFLLLDAKRVNKRRRLVQVNTSQVNTSGNV